VEIITLIKKSQKSNHWNGQLRAEGVTKITYPINQETSKWSVIRLGTGALAIARASENAIMTYFKEATIDRMVGTYFELKTNISPLEKRLQKLTYLSPLSLTSNWFVSFDPSKQSEILKIIHEKFPKYSPRT